MGMDRGSRRLHIAMPCHAILVEEIVRLRRPLLQYQAVHRIDMHIDSMYHMESTRIRSTNRTAARNAFEHLQQVHCSVAGEQQ